MTVQDFTECILKTSATWSNFENNLKTALSTDATLGPNKSVLDIGDGNVSEYIGFVSCCGLITCDWVGATPAEALPKTVIPSILPLRRLNDTLPEGQKLFYFDEARWAQMETQISEIHNTEVALYDFLEEFEGLLMPRRIFGRLPEEKESGQLCLEYVENSRTMNVYERHSVEQVRQIARALGKIQACSLKKEVTNPMLQHNFWSKMAEHWSLESFHGTFKGMAAHDGSEKTTALMAKMDALAPLIYASFTDAPLHTNMGIRGVLVNGDLHTGNVLIDKDSGNVAALIDWQCAHLGVGVEDLLRIAMFALTMKERRAALPALIEEMYNSMVEHLDGVGTPYTLDQMFILSDLIFPSCALFFASDCLAVVATLEKDLSLTDAERIERKEVMLDKIIGVLEDVVDLDAKNNNSAAKEKYI